MIAPTLLLVTQLDIPCTNSHLEMYSKGTVHNKGFKILPGLNQQLVTSVLIGQVNSRNTASHKVANTTRLKKFENFDCRFCFAWDLASNV